MTALLTALPFLILVVFLVRGRYPGERLLVRRTPPRRRRVTPLVLTPRPRRRTSPRGAALLAAALGRRGPPLPA